MVAVPVRVWPVTMAVSVTDPPRAMLAALSADAVVVPGAEGCEGWRQSVAPAPTVTMQFAGPTGLPVPTVSASQTLMTTASPAVRLQSLVP